MKRFQGIFTALVTPFKDGKIDEAAYQTFIDWQIGQGVHGIVPCGTTGESPTLSHDEHRRLIDLAVEAAGGRVTVMAGAGSNNTAEAIELTRYAKKAGADAVLLVAPYYNKPPQAGIYAHYKAIAESAEIPCFIYNIPGRSVVDISDETLAELAKIPNIAGVKDATGDLARVCTLRKAAGDDFILLSGEDMTAVGFNAQGGKGCISVTSNVAPALCAKIQELTLKGEFVEAQALQDTLVPLHEALFCETNPIPVKHALGLMGKISPDLRLPLVAASPAAQARLKSAMTLLGLI